MSFDPGLMAALRELAPGSRAAWSACGATPDAPGSARCRALRYRPAGARARPQFLAYRVQDLTTAAAAGRAPLLRWPLLTWTVRTRADRASAARYADQMIFEGFRP